MKDRKHTPEYEKLEYDCREKISEIQRCMGAMRTERENADRRKELKHLHTWLVAALNTVLYPVSGDSK